MNNKYIGHYSQVLGVEEHRLVGGRGDGMRLFQVRNGKGLEFTVSADRGADISRLSFKGDNFAFMSPRGYVAPSYYDDKGAGMVKSFTAGFLTTCGLTTIGTPSTDAGEELPLHGSISNCPADRVNTYVTDKDIVIEAEMNESNLCSDKLILKRTIRCSLESNEIEINDVVENIGTTISPLMILYHFNIAYPLLHESSELFIPSSEVKARDDFAQKDISKWSKISKPMANMKEQCYYHSFENKGFAGIFNRELDKGVVINFDPKILNKFVQWKMMGEKDYVMGLEPGNALPDGRDVARESGELEFIRPDKKVEYWVKINIVDGIKEWNKWRLGC